MYVRYARGFTLIEALISVTLISLIVGMTLPFYGNFAARNDINIAQEDVARMMRRAQAYARAGYGDSTWGVRLQNGSATLFRGTTYATRSAAYDEILSFPAINVSGVTDVVFSKMTGYPSATGTTTLASTAVNVTKTISLNVYGTVNF